MGLLPRVADDMQSRSHKLIEKRQATPTLPTAANDCAARDVVKRVNRTLFSVDGTRRWQRRDLSHGNECSGPHRLAYGAHFSPRRILSIYKAWLPITLDFQNVDGAWRQLNAGSRSSS